MQIDIGNLNLTIRYLERYSKTLKSDMKIDVEDRDMDRYKKHKAVQCDV